MSWFDWDLDAAWSLDGILWLVDVRSINPPVSSSGMILLPVRSLDVMIHSAIGSLTVCRLLVSIVVSIVVSIGVPIGVSIGVEMCVEIEQSRGVGNVSVCPMSLVHFVPLYTHRYWLELVDVHV